jgi:RNA polymerase sigma-70 factor (ECF subfamily)
VNGVSEVQYEQLLSLARQGCRRSRGELLDRYRKYLKALARVQLHRSLQVKADASDLVQETFLRAHDAFQQFRGTEEQQLLGWLRAILASRLAKHARRHLAQRRSLTLEQRLAEDLERSSIAMDQCFVHQGPSPSEVVSRQEQVVLVASAIEDLRDDYRTVILLRHVQGLPYAEVAAAMNRSADSVKKLWVRALAQLQRTMERIS